MVGLECIRCSNVIVFGKARKLEGGEGAKRPFEILSQPGGVLKPVDKPPHPLKLSEVLDWTVSYTTPEPCIWLVTLRAWYKLIDPSPQYLRVFAPMQRRVAFTAVAAEMLRLNWAVSLDDAMAKCAAETQVVPGDLLDPRFRVIAASNAAATERERKESEAANVAAEKGEETEADGEDKKEIADDKKPPEVVPLRYTTRDVVDDGAFIATQLEALRTSGALMEGTELTKPPLIDQFKNILEVTKKKELLDAKVARNAAQRAAQRQAQRERLAATRRGDGSGGSRPSGASHHRKPVPSGPREPRTGTPPVPEPVVPETYAASPALVAETLALWDMTQVHGKFFRLPPCPWPRFSRAFLAPAEGTVPADAALIRDVCVALLRVGESGVAGAGAGGGENAAAATRRLQKQPRLAKASSEMEEPEDLLMLDWSERVGATLGVYTAGTAAEAVGVLGPGPPTWPSQAIKQGAARAAKALAGCDEGANVTGVLSPPERVALAVGLSCVACDSEEMGEVMKAKTESTRAAHNMGQLPLAPRRVKPKPLALGAPVVSVPKSTDKPDWAETLIEWVRNAPDRGAYLRHRPIGTDETGRAYHILGGAAGAAMLFVQEPTDLELERRNAGAETDDEDTAAHEKKPKIETGTGGDVAMKSEETIKTPEKMENPSARGTRIAAEARASIKLRRKENDAFSACGTFEEWPTRWGCFAVGPGLKHLKEWLDDDPRNPRCADERRLKSISALLMKTVLKPALKAEGEDVETKVEGNATPQMTPDAFDQFNLREDGYTHLDKVLSTNKSQLDPSKSRNDAATALCSVVRFVLSGSTKFWTQTNPWLKACLNLCAALPDELGTGAVSTAPGDSKGDRLAVLISRVLPPLEAMLRSSGATHGEWLERREAWFTGLRGMEDFDLRVPPAELMSVEQAEEAVALASAQAAEAIEWSTTDGALEQSLKLSVPRSARLLATLCSALAPDPLRLTQTQFLAATPSATHVGVKTCAPGSIVALVRKGFKLTRERYLDMRVAPEGWIPLRELRTVERCVVRAVAYRGAVPPPVEYPEMGGTPPCCWVLLELVDLPMMVPGRRKAGEGPNDNTGPRLISAPIFAGGEIADYIIDWGKYQQSFDRPWSKGSRIQMLFEDLTTGADPNAYGALQMAIEPEPDLPPHAAQKVEKVDQNQDDADADVTMADQVPEGAEGAENKNVEPKKEEAPDAKAEGDAKDDPKPVDKAKVGILKGENGAEYWLGRVSRVRGGDDPWENTQVVFDSDPNGEEPMWVCPWEIELAPDEFQPKEGDEGVKVGDDGFDSENRSEAHQKKCDDGEAIAVRLGWPQATSAAREEFNTWREVASPDARPARAPTFCGSELDLYKVTTEVLRCGGYDLVTHEKNWKKIAKMLGKDLTTQTSASFALRNHYQRCLLDFENWLWTNAETLGPRPDAFDANVTVQAAQGIPTATSNDLDVSMEEAEEPIANEPLDETFADSEDEAKEDPKSDDEKEEPEGDEAFDPDAESDVEEEESDEDFEIKPSSASKKRGRDSDEEYE